MTLSLLFPTTTTVVNDTEITTTTTININIIINHDDNSKKCAVKIVNKAQFASEFDGLELLKTEIEILRWARHDHVIHLFDVFDTKSQVFITMELAEGCVVVTLSI